MTKIMDPRMAKAVCRSSEEMMAGMTEVNQMEHVKNLVILSMDVSAMFPSMDIAKCAKVAAKMFFEAGMELNLNTEELGLYVAVTVEIQSCPKDSFQISKF